MQELLLLSGYQTTIYPHTVLASRIFFTDTVNQVSLLRPCPLCMCKIQAESDLLSS